MTSGKKNYQNPLLLSSSYNLLINLRDLFCRDEEPDRPEEAQEQHAGQALQLPAVQVLRGDIEDQEDAPGSYNRVKHKDLYI